MIRCFHVLSRGLALAVTLAATMVVLQVGMALAQLNVATSEEYLAWLAEAEAAEATIDNVTASNSALRAARAGIAGYRDRFSRLRDENVRRINTLSLQLEALGPAPGEGEEPREVAELRAGITDDLNRLRVPAVLAEESRSRAVGLIQEIDGILDERQIARLYRRDPSPLLPASIALAFGDFGRTDFVLAETRALMESSTVRGTLLKRVPEITLALALALFLMVWGVRLAGYVSDRLARTFALRKGVSGALSHVLCVALPYLGVLLLAATLKATGLFGLRGHLLLDTFPKWGATVIGFIWLSHMLFARRGETVVFAVEPAGQKQMEVLAVLSALTLILLDLAGLYESVVVVTQAAVSVMHYPLIVLQALVLFRIQRIVFAAEYRPGTGTGGELKGVRSLLRRLLVVALVLSVLLGAAGYVELTGGFVVAVTWSLVLVGAILVVQDVFTHLWVNLARRGTEAKDHLSTTIVSILVWVLSLPLFALVWGARPAQLAELWQRFVAGIRIGETILSPAILLSLLLIFGLGILATRIVQSTLANRLLPKTRMDPGVQVAIVSGVGYTGFALAALIAVAGAGLDLSSLAIIAGALTVGIGFGLQNIVSNFVSGIILLVERPVSKGDWIEVGGKMGYVRDISVRSTRIETFDRTDVIVPNSDLISGTVVNYTKGNTIGRVIVPVGVAYGTDTRKVERILGEVAASHHMVMEDPAPSVVFRGFGADSLDFEIRAILRDVNWVLAVKSELNHGIAQRFAEEGIEIPFAQRDIWLRNPETLSGSVPDRKPES